jgi:hypothetical protein
MVFRNPARANDHLGAIMLASSSARPLTARWACAKGKGDLNGRLRAGCLFASCLILRLVEFGSSLRPLYTCVISIALDLVTFSDSVSPRSCDLSRPSRPTSPELPFRSGLRRFEN